MVPMDRTGVPTLMIDSSLVGIHISVCVSMMSNVIGCLALSVVFNRLGVVLASLKRGSVSITPSSSNWKSSRDSRLGTS